MSKVSFVIPCYRSSKTIRKVVGPKFPILFRISLDHRFNGGRTLEDSVPLLGILEKAGVDAFDVDVASYEHLDLIYPTVYYGDSVTSYVCKEARKHVSVPIINGGRHTMETAVDLLESGDADIIQFGRQLIADPDFPNKLKDNRRDDIRPCLLCNEECIGRIMGRQSQLSCTVNIQACMEGHYQITKLPEPKNVVVIGAGPGGLEAARVAAMRGCKVTLFEKSGKIGGNFGTIASVGFKHRIRDLIWWYNNQLNKLGVDLRLNTEITADDPILGSADAIFLATGSVPLVPPIPGADLPNVMTVLDYHRYGTDGQNIVICGGGLSGCDAAIELHGEGKNVSIIEMQDDIAKDAQFINSITIHELELLEGEGTEYVLRVRCSKGTYVRTLCHDLGSALGCGGCMSSLRRTRAGSFTLSQAVTMQQVLDFAAEHDPQELLMPVDAVFSVHPPLIVTLGQAAKLKNGAQVRDWQFRSGTYRVYAEDGEFLLLGRVENGLLTTIKSFFEVNTLAT